MAYQDLMGNVFDRLTVIEFAGRLEKGRAVWKCRCICGKEVITRARNLTKGHKKSCGCLTSAHYTHRGTGTRLHSIWGDMKGRCYNAKNCNYKNYGERGISVCEEWLNDFGSFRQWSLSNGYEETLTIDRIDNNGNYEPNNCRWATMFVQHYNKRTNRTIIYEGKKLTSLDIELTYGVPRALAYSRMKEGWDLIDIINTPLHKNRKNGRKASGSKVRNRDKTTGRFVH